MDELMENVREQIYKVMFKNDWTLTRMSVECGISHRELHAILRKGHKGIRLSTLAKISEGANKPIRYFIDKEWAGRCENRELLYKIYRDSKRQLQKEGVV